VSYALPLFQGPTQLRGDLALAKTPQIATLPSVTIEASQGFSSLGLIPVGTQNLTLTLQTPRPGQSLQVLTRDGRHLVGSALNDTQKDQMVKASIGMEVGATYSNQTLNRTAPASYLGMDIFMGAKASVSLVQQFNATTGEAQAPTAVTAKLTGNTFLGSNDPIAANTFQLNGQNLPALSGPLTLNSVINWVNTATASDPVTSRITASSQDGKLVLSRPSSNTTQDIRLGLGSNGIPADLKRLGFDTTLSIEGATPDDLLIFVTDTAIPANSSSSVSVSAQFTDIAGNMKQTLRASPLQVSFTSDSTYKIVDTRTNTIVAERQLQIDPNNNIPKLSYRGLSLEFSTAPKSGDVFSIDGNKDGIGNNETMLRMVALEDEAIMPGGLTITEAYIERVNQVGSVARQAAIAEQALSVVYQQAQEARDGISGVSLDEEASALVRFQQAYQANAKVMQVSMALFDAILQVR
jgi:flagellar hook-associated protein FlgK